MTPEDRTLLELAAKAAGLEGFTVLNGLGAVLDRKLGVMQPYSRWNPLTDDGDALSLLVRLKLTLVVESDMVFVRTQLHSKAFSERFHGFDPSAATRRAIVRAAAEIGKALSSQSPEQRTS